MASDSSKRRSTGGEIGATGLQLAHGGTAHEELHPNLMGRQAIRVYREMADNDPTVGAILFTFDMLLRQVDWYAEEGEGDAEDVEFLESCINDMSMSWADTISEILSMTRYGFSFHEIVYKVRRGRQKEDSKIESSKYDDGKIGWARLPIRSQDTLQEWSFDKDTGKIMGFVQLSAPLYKRVVIPMSKGLLFRTTSYKGNPEGRSLLRNAYRPWFFKNRIEVIEGVGIERDLAGFPVIYVPASYLADTATANEKAIVAKFAEIGANLRRDKQEFVIMPRAYDTDGNELFGMELMSAGGTRTFDTSAIITRYDQRIAMTVLADFILLGHEKVGSFALSSDKTDLFAVALGTLLDTIEETINRFAIPRLWEMNGWDPSKAPVLRHGDIEDRDLAVLGAFLQQLSTLGMPLFPDDDLDKWLRKVARLPERSEEAIEMQRQMQQEQQQAQLDMEQGVMEDGNGEITFGDGAPAPQPAGAGPARPPRRPGQPTATPTQ